MPNYKLTFTYTQYNQQWSEVWYNTASTLGAAANFPPGLPTNLVNPCHISVQLIKCRVSDTASNRSSIVVLFNNLYGKDSSGTADITNTTALLSFVAPSIGASRKLWKRGLSDASVLRNNINGTAAPSGNLVAYLNQYITSVVNAGFQIRAVTRMANPPVAPNVWTPLGTVSAVANTQQISIATTVAPLPAVGSLVSINRVDQKLFPGLRGVFQVLSNVTGSFSIGWNSPVTLTTVPLSGRWKPVVYTYGDVEDDGSGFQLFTSRKTGKNSQGGRGARSPQRLRHAQ